VPQPPPPGQKATLSDQRTVVIVIDSNHKIQINGEDSDWDHLGPRLTEIFKTRAERVVFVKGATDLDFLWVARAIDVAHGAGIDKVGLMTDKTEAAN
jgi:biopolymer transport protein TolR